MRTLGAAILVMLVAAGEAAAIGSGAPATLTLSGPSTTSYGHRVTLAGRLSPARAAVEVGIYRGSSLVAATRTRANGSYVIRPRLHRPGPYRARADGLLSPPLAIRILPALEASFHGSPVIGAALRLEARLRPIEAGTLRVRVWRGHRQTLRALFPAVIRVRLGTESGRPIRIELASLPRPGFLPATATVRARLARPTLRAGAGNPAIGQLVDRLAQLRYAVPRRSTSFGSGLRDAVIAFQKVHGLQRDGVVGARTWAKLARPIRPAPRYASPHDHLEIDIARQVLYVVRDGSIDEIVPVSTAGVPGYRTPVGRFAIERKILGWRRSRLGVLFNPMYFLGGYAIHGSPSVPPYPASHGCVRVPIWLTNRLFAQHDYGKTVYIY
jgi:hypothetical protein